MATRRLWGEKNHEHVFLPGGLGESATSGPESATSGPKRAQHQVQRERNIRSKETATSGPKRAQHQVQRDRNIRSRERNIRSKKSATSGPLQKKLSMPFLLRVEPGTWTLLALLAPFWGVPQFHHPPLHHRSTRSAPLFRNTFQLVALITDATSRPNRSDSSNWLMNPVQSDPSSASCRGGPTPWTPQLQRLSQLRLRRTTPNDNDLPPFEIERRHRVKPRNTSVNTKVCCA